MSKSMILLVEVDKIYIPSDTDELTDQEKFNDNLGINYYNQTNDFAGTSELQVKEAVAKLKEWKSSDDESLEEKKETVLNACILKITKGSHSRQIDTLLQVNIIYTKNVF